MVSLVYDNCARRREGPVGSQGLWAHPLGQLVATRLVRRRRTFARVAKAWDNPDLVDVTLHSYRARWDEAKPDPSSQWLEDKVEATKTLSLPTMYVQGAVDGVNPPSASKDVSNKFSRPVRLRHTVGCRTLSTTREPGCRRASPHRFIHRETRRILQTPPTGACT